MTAPALPAVDALVHAKRTPDVTAIPKRTAFVVEGTGAPEGEAFQQSIGALFTAAYTLKFQRKAERRSDFRVGPLEGEWDVENLAAARGGWRWSLRITVPDDVTASDAKAAIAKAKDKTGVRPALRRVPARRYGRILHVGTYASEPDSFARLDAMLDARGLKRERRHIEVYLSDPRRVAPERNRTALLVPLRPSR